MQGITISRSDLRMDRNLLNRVRMNLPTRNDQKFKVIYLLVQGFLRGSKLDEAKHQTLVAIISVIHHEKSRINELIDSIASNIISGNSREEAFKRLEYLLKPRQVSFN